MPRNSPKYIKHQSKLTFPRNKFPQLVILIFLYFLGICITLIFRPSYILNILIVYLPGIIYGFTLIENSRRKILLFTLVSILFIIPVEFLARLTDSWDVASSFPRLLGIAPIENMVYGLINICYPLIFYEYFYDADRNYKISARWKKLILLYVLLFVITFSIFFVNPAFLRLQYWMLGIFILLPILVLVLRYKPHIPKRLVLPAIVFGTMFAIHEVISMYLGHWWWPGNYLFTMNIYGYTYPLDDVLIWLVFSNIAVISGYEVFWD